jgi:hypothetical protein
LEYGFCLTLDENPALLFSGICMSWMDISFGDVVLALGIWLPHELE